MALPAHLGYVGLALLVSGESLGLFLPGEATLLAAGVLAREGSLEIALVILVAAVAAIVGDNVGFVLGRRGGRHLLLRKGPFLAPRVALLRRGEDFFDRHGGSSVFLARWIAVARVTAPWLAGAGRMPPRRFLLWNALGGITWSAAVGLAGYVIGAAANALLPAETVLLVLLVAAGALAAVGRHRSWNARA